MRRVHGVVRHVKHVSFSRKQRTPMQRVHKLARLTGGVQRRLQNVHELQTDAAHVCVDTHVISCCVSSRRSDAAKYPPIGTMPSFPCVLHTHAHSRVRHTHVRTHTYTYTRMHTHTLAHTHTCTRTKTHTCAHIHAHTELHAHTHLRLHTHTHTHTFTHTNAHMHLRAHTHAQKHASCTDAQAHTSVRVLQHIFPSLN